MPQNPADLIDDLVKMRVYQPTAMEAADSITQAELRTALFISMVGQGKPKRERLVRDLIKLAGGLDQAFSAAFGPKAGEFFNDAKRTSQVTRRKFLQNIAVGAALVTLANCGSASELAEETAGEAPDVGNLEKTNLKVAFLPITCSTPIIMSEPLGFYDKYGLDVELIKYFSWSVVRDAAIAGDLDAYHMLAPMPIAMSLGLGSAPFPVRLASIENNNGQGIAVAKKHLGNINGPEDFRGMSIGIPYDYSNHNLLIRYYLASGGLDPDKDVNLFILPPPDAIAQMAAGQIDAFILPDNFAQRVVQDDIGFIHMLSKDLWEGHPCCAFVATQNWINSNPQTFRALNKAIIDGANYANDPANRKEIAAAIAPQQYLNQPLAVLEAVMTGQFDDGQGNTFDVPDRIYFDPYPWKSFASWITTQLVRWNYMPPDKATNGGEDFFLTELARELAIELGVDAPQELSRIEKMQFGDFDPNQAEKYLQDQINQFGV
ncbi:abc-type nitrate sulfonate bicarbonate transport periplasmic component [Leptolyngbya sp. Heron Island J]|uniref:ABC transporter substrate-binding protein n=1 Tax=Leptolyngbya sp. Heron Island J TaxID=1385935 RepID=UPI0003B9F642|nr:ABC transporter substrate-binding protein [Leptolyngbya sp. Heron Island J]ESA36487.1 abc-type nitrate sulfonate bicarbonate transport periplasmic component [Leptolyngbya sp. Heron Island J]